VISTAAVLVHIGNAMGVDYLLDWVSAAAVAGEQIRQRYPLGSDRLKNQLTGKDLENGKKKTTNESPK